MRAPVHLTVLLVACTPAPEKVRQPTLSETDVPLEETDPAPRDCEPLGSASCPIPVSTFPFMDAGDTRSAPESLLDSYACAPDTDESGGEFWYEIALVEEGLLTATVQDTDADIDLHLLTEDGTCLTRDDAALGWRLEPGIYFLIADSYQKKEGAYDLTLRFFGESGPCAMTSVDQKMYWTACATGVDCVERGDERFLRMPVLGEVVQEAHLVTTDDGFGSAWPSSPTDGLSDHYARSEAYTGLVVDRDQDWAPAGEGGSMYGQGSTGAKVPIEDEAWYVNMYWRNRPEKGTRMFVIDPYTGAGVVASGGYETGPGSNTAIGGAVEEIHKVLGTTHRDRLIMGFATDPDLPLGPIVCD